MSDGTQPAPRSAYSGLTVLDLSQVLLGPYCTMLMSRLGADVVKIEPPSGDPLRQYRGADGGETAGFGLINTGKRGLCLDLKKEAGRELFLRLVEGADVVVENFGPNTLERLGLQYGVLAERNPRIILASGRGYGADGPYRDYLAMDLMIQAVSGVLTTTGFPENPPVKAGVPIADLTAGIHLMAAIAVALYQRELTGRGQHVSVAMHDCLLPTLNSPLGSWLDSRGTHPERTGNRHSGLAVAPYNVYPTSDGWIAILALTDRHWQNLCTAMGRDDLAARPELEKNRDRVDRMDEIDEIISEWSAHHAKRDLFERLGAAGVPAAPVLSLGEVVDDPQVRSQGMLQEVDGRNGRRVLTYGNPLRLSASAPVPATPPPDVGSDSEALLVEKLGLDADELARLVDAGVI